MKFFSLTKKSSLPKVSQFVTGVDGKVIARKGDRPDSEFVEQVAGLHPGGIFETATVAETDLFLHFKTLLNLEKYRFITDNEVTLTYLLSILGRVPVNRLILNELKWMKRFEYFYHHSLVITAIITRMALDFWNDSGRAVQAAGCSLVHDVGITRVPQEILEKVSRLTEEENSIIKEHPIYSYLLLVYYSGNTEDQKALTAYEHHEDPLGTGYPRGIEQNDILVQMIKMADVFDALITNRPFRPALSKNQALEVFEEDVDAGKINRELPVLLRSYLLPHLDG